MDLYPDVQESARNSDCTKMEVGRFDSRPFNRYLVYEQEPCASDRPYTNYTSPDTHSTSLNILRSFVVAGRTRG